MKLRGIRPDGIKSRTGFLIALLAIFTAAQAAAHPQAPRNSKNSSEETHRVVVRTVHDGDTVSVRFSDGKTRRVRLLGVDAAEITGGTDETRFRGETARRFAYLTLFNKTVRLTYDSERTDKYGRILAYIWMDDGTLFNELIVREGFASVLRWFPLRDDLMSRLRDAEKKARAGKRGLWGGPPFPVVAAGRAGRAVGRLASVSFVCRGVVRRGSVTLIEARGTSFQAVIPKNRLSAFPNLENLTGVRIEVFGLIEDYRGTPQIMLFSPFQIKTVF
jgi:micrococcal nuclease